MMIDDANDDDDILNNLPTSSRFPISSIFDLLSFNSASEIFVLLTSFLILWSQIGESHKLSDQLVNSSIVFTLFVSVLCPVRMEKKSSIFLTSNLE